MQAQVNSYRYHHLFSFRYVQSVTVTVLICVYVSLIATICYGQNSAPDKQLLNAILKADIPAMKMAVENGAVLNLDTCGANYSTTRYSPLTIAVVKGDIGTIDELRMLGLKLFMIDFDLFFGFIRGMA